MLFIDLMIIILLSATLGIIVVLINIKNRAPEIDDSVDIKIKINVHKYFIYPQGYENSLQSRLGYDDEYIYLVETDQDDVYEMHINNDYIGYIDGTEYVTIESENYDDFFRLKVRISEITEKIHVIQSVSDDRVFVYGRFTNNFYLKNINDIESSIEDYNSKNLIFERSKRTI